MFIADSTASASRTRKRTLTPKQRRFIAARITNPAISDMEAARQAGYRPSTAEHADRNVVANAGPFIEQMKRFVVALPTHRSVNGVSRRTWPPLSQPTMSEASAEIPVRVPRPGPAGPHRSSCWPPFRCPTESLFEIVQDAALALVELDVI